MDSMTVESIRELIQRNNELEEKNNKLETELAQEKKISQDYIAKNSELEEKNFKLESELAKSKKTNQNLSELLMKTQRIAVEKATMSKKMENQYKQKIQMLNEEVEEIKSSQSRDHQMYTDSLADLEEDINYHMERNTKLIKALHLATTKLRELEINTDDLQNLTTLELNKARRGISKQMKGKLSTQRKKKTKKTCLHSIVYTPSDSDVNDDESDSK